MTTYFKYRTLDNWEFLLDALVNRRLYAARFKTLNDPMEGKFRYRGSEVDYEQLADIKAHKAERRILSLSKSGDNHLLWAYYAGGHAGVALEVVPRLGGGDELFDMKYEGAPLIDSTLLEHQVRSIFEQKHSSWEHEQEARVLSLRDFVDVDIKRVILGQRIPKARAELLCTLLERLDIPYVRFSQFAQ